MVIVPFLLLYPFYPFCCCTLFLNVPFLLLCLVCYCVGFVVVPFSFLLLCRFCYCTCCCTHFVTVFCYCTLFVTVPFLLTSGTRSSPATALSDVTLCVGEKAHAALLCRQCNFQVICAVFTWFIGHKHAVNELDRSEWLPAVPRFWVKGFWLYWRARDLNCSFLWDCRATYVILLSMIAAVSCLRLTRFIGHEHSVNWVRSLRTDIGCVRVRRAGLIILNSCTQYFAGLCEYWSPATTLSCTVIHTRTHTPDLICSEGLSYTATAL